MKKFTTSKNKQVEAIQFGSDDSTNHLVELCSTSPSGEIFALAKDVPITKNSFKAVKTKFGFEKIHDGDWIVKKESELSVISHSVFQMMFNPI